MKAKPKCQELRSWLRSNLGRYCCGCLTGSSDRALSAAVHILDLHTIDDRREHLRAFGFIVRNMEPAAQQLAFHAIAFVSEWHLRPVWWNAAGLAPLEFHRVCAFEPGGCFVDLDQSEPAIQAALAARKSAETGARQ